MLGANGWKEDYMQNTKEKCMDCMLSETCGNVNARPGFGNPNANLIILLDTPGRELAEKLLIWLLWKLGLTGNDVWVDYVFKCGFPKGKKFKKKELLHPHYVCWQKFPRKTDATSFVIAGNWGVQLVLETTMKKAHGRKDSASGAWVTYDFNYLLLNPAQCEMAWCVLYKAAEEAGLSPHMVIDVPPFRFPSKKL